MSRWLTIVGVGEDGWEGLAARARLAITDAEAVVGSSRLLDLVPRGQAELHLWPQPFAAVVDRIRPLRGRRTVILATGDPMNYGVARKLMEFIPFAEMEVIPNLSAFSLAAARMGWSLPDCDTLTLHGRDAAHLEPFIQPDVRLIVLTADRSTIPEVARRLVARGFGQSAITVLENMGGAREGRASFRADAVPGDQFSDLNTLAIHCLASPGARLLSRISGLPDEAFQHDGQLTKREVRAATLAALGPSPDRLLWDVGAGCGSVSIEWMRAARGCQAIAFEASAERLGMIVANAESLGTPRLRVVAGEAPHSYRGMATPDAVFIGGGILDDGVFDGAWSQLRPGGTLVANVVTIDGEQRLYDLHARHGGDIVRMEVSNLTHVGNLRALRPRMAVTQWRTSRPW